MRDRDGRRILRTAGEGVLYESRLQDIHGLKEKGRRKTTNEEGEVISLGRKKMRQQTKAATMRVRATISEQKKQKEKENKEKGNTDTKRKIPKKGVACVRRIIERGQTDVTLRRRTTEYQERQRTGRLGDRSVQSEQTGNFHHWIEHRLTGGSSLLCGAFRSISPKHVSKTLAVMKRMTNVAVSDMRIIVDGWRFD